MEGDGEDRYEGWFDVMELFLHIMAVWEWWVGFLGFIAVRNEPIQGSFAA